MRKITFALIWVVSFLLLLLVCDQFLLRYPGGNTPLFSDFQHFYHDFRQRVIALDSHTALPRTSAPITTGARPTMRSSTRSSTMPSTRATTVEAVLATRADEMSSSGSKANGVGYIYVDEDNTLSFAARWEDIPPALRASAKPLDN